MSMQVARFIAAKSATICRITSEAESKVATEYGAALSTTIKWNNNITQKGYHTTHLHTTTSNHHFLNDRIIFTKKECGVEHGVEKIRRIMKSVGRKYGDLEELIMIDSIQRLGLEDYFREEILVALQKQHIKYYCSFEDGGDDQLYEIALRFRLFRQYGYNTPADIFNKFTDNDGEFRQELCKDEKGLLSLYEASQLTKHGEDILDEASKFSARLLKAASFMDVTRPSKTKIVENTLRNPYHKSLARLMTKSFLHEFEVSLECLHDFNITNDWIYEVQDLAKLDLNMAQTTYRDDLHQLSRWGKELNSAKELDFARIEPIKWYVWSLGAFPGPKMAEEREELAKAVSFIYIIDDIFDVYGTLDDLFLFTEAINRWEYADSERLPNYMKVCFKALQKLTNEFSCKILRKHGWNPKPSLQKLWADLCNAFLIESRWCASKELPSSKEYLKNGIVSSGLHVVLAHAFFLLGQGVNKKSVDELNSLPSIVASTAAIVRLWNDVGVDKDEDRDGDDGSYVDCYVKEKGCSYESAREHVNRMISDAWKCLNEEYMSPTSPFSTDFRLACLNFARMVPIVYDHDESHHLRSLMNLLNSSMDENLN